MSIRIRMAPVFMFTSICFAAPGVWGGEPDEEMRKGARTIANMERPMAKHDLKGYCAATRGSPEYPGYVVRACQFSVKNNLKKAEDCSDENVKKEVAKDNATCLAMSTGDFDKEMAAQRKGWERTFASMKDKGVDADKLMKEERAKIK
ncbi:MAG: hypothetical protein ABI790_01765 [Betaproteobacteria bacterium]